ncbi:MAG: CPBP family intramembrane glutamic endopeptidase [Bryobacteraceae bacterium]
MEVAEGPPPPVIEPVTARTLTRDAIFDLIASLVVGIGGIMLMGALVGVSLLIAGNRPEQVTDLVTSPWGIAGLLLGTQLPLLFFALRRRRRNRQKQRPMTELFGGAGLNAIPIGIFAGMGLTVLSALYTSGLQRLLGPDSVSNQVEFLQRMLDNKSAVTLLVLLIAVGAPICEELFFRGVIFGAARAAGLTKVGVVLSAVLFATVHFSLLLSPFYATFAIVMCWLYARTGTLAAPMAAHATMNGIACAALLLAGDRV